MEIIVFIASVVSLILWLYLLWEFIHLCKDVEVIRYRLLEILEHLEKNLNNDQNKTKSKNEQQ